jgi:hypothetical protein
MQHRRRRTFKPLVRWLAIVILTLAPATTTFAQRDTQEQDPIDARLEGYNTNVTLPAASTGLTWFLFVILMVFMAAGLFKDAKRSHLD